MTRWLDGALGTELIARGAPENDPESWVDTAPDEVTAHHLRMRAAGAEAVYAASFSAPRRARRGDEPLVLARITRAVSLAVRATSLPLEAAAPIPVSRRPDVWAPLGPGMHHPAMVAAAAQAGATTVVLETFLDFAELIVALQHLAGEGLPVVASFCPHPRKRLGDDDLERLVAELAEAGAWAVGVNCGDGRGDVLRVAGMLVGRGLPVIARPSAGLPGQRIAPEAFAKWADELCAIGVAAVGGCCGVTPAHLVAARHSALER